MLGLAELAAWTVLARRDADSRIHGGLNSAGMLMRPPGSVRPWSVRPWSVRSGLQGLDESGRDGLLGALVGDQQPAGQVDGHADAADHREHGEDDPYDSDVYVEVAGDAGGDSRQHPVVEGAAQRRRAGLVDGFRVRGGLVD